MKLDLNIDIGEGGGHDFDLLSMASSANIACGGHAGGGVTMHAAIETAGMAGVAIGAHPGYRDPGNFGRVETGESGWRVASEVRRQLLDYVEAAGEPPHHVKLHGALYHRADHDTEVARLLCLIVLELAPQAWIYALPGGGFSRAAETSGLAICGEGFIDRAYETDGRLVPRSRPGAVLDSAEVAAAQALRLTDRSDIGTLCVHGDEPHAVELLRQSRRALEAAGITIAAP